MRNPFKKKTNTNYYIIPAKCPNCRRLAFPHAEIGVPFKEYHKDTKDFTCWYCGCVSPASDWEFFPDFDSWKFD